MLSSLVLDALLVLILLMVIPLGFFRGGLREVCTSAGLLLGILLAEQWAERWGRPLADLANIDTGAATFVVAVSVVVLAAAIVGYGASAAFTYKPGPGGRLYGGYLALLNGMVFTGFLINAITRYALDGERPKLVADGYVSRALSVGFEWVLLAGAGGILLATLFGMFVRERAEEEFTYVPQQHPRPQADPYAQAAPRRVAPAAESEKIEPTPVDETPAPTAPVRIREVRHWEDRSEPPQREFGGGWQRTWPGAAGSAPPRKPWEQAARPKAHPAPPSGSAGAKPANEKEILRQWLDQDRSESDE